MRLDKYMATYWPEYSRSTWQIFIEQGLVLVNSLPVKSPKHQLDEDDHVTHLDLPSLDDQSIELPVIYEDDRVLVIDKPVGVLTHAKGEISEELTVADFVRPRMSEVDETNRPGIVHRLDRQTSGVLIAAKDLVAKKHLQKQFQDRKAKKTYAALVEGSPKLNEANIELPIGRNPRTPSQFKVDAHGKSALTYYRVARTGKNTSLITLKPTTGRTHQLRVHMQHIGTPIVGDTVYGKKNQSGEQRLYLHAHQLEITLPGGNRQTFTSEIPDSFISRLDK